MRIAVSGSSGLIGSALVAHLRAQGHEALRLVRHEAAPRSDEVAFDPSQGLVDATALEGLDGVVHLAGANVAEGRWTKARMAEIWESRRLPTLALARALAGLRRKPRVLVCASAVGAYGSRGDAWQTEDSPRGNGFLADVCRAWEEACAPAAAAGIRVVNLRFGVVLSRHGGALAKMLTPFKLGAGGRLGAGTQWMPWVSLADAVAAAAFALSNDALSGPVNVTAPEPVTNQVFTKALGRALGRPTFAPMPAFAARLLFGRMADEMLLASTRAAPARLEAARFVFQHRDIHAALAAALSDAAAPAPVPQAGAVAAS